MVSGNYPVREVQEASTAPMRRDIWPATLPPIAEVLSGGLQLGPATVFVGANGAGKSTLVEAIAAAYGLGSEGGSTGSQHSTRPTESSLASHLTLIRNAGATRRGYFLRAETMHGLFTYLEDDPALSREDIAFHEMSHGESFITLARDRFRGEGLWILDEPESALSFEGCIKLLELLTDLVQSGGSQVIMSTHSPVLAAMPGATIYELGDWGLHYSTWGELELVSQWRTFMQSPQRFLRG